MNYYIFLSALCCLLAYSADQSNAEHLYDMPLVSDDGHIVMIPKHLVLYSTVLTRATNFASNRHTSFGFPANMLCLLLKILNFESIFAHELTNDYTNFHHNPCYQSYALYNHLLQRATNIFKGLCLTSYTQARAFEIAHFFNMPATMLCIANIGSTDDLHYDVIKDLVHSYTLNCPYPYIPIYLTAVRQQLAQKDSAARYNYLKYGFIDPFFKGLTIFDLLKMGTIEALHAQQNKFSLSLANTQLYSLSGIEAMDYRNLCKKLSLAHNFFTYISPRDISLFTNLEYLDLTNNFLNKANFVSALPLLRSLVLAHNKIKKLPNGIQRLKELEQLDVSRNYLTDISIAPHALNNLVLLNLHTNYINNFTKGPDSLKNIQMIDLGINRMRTFPLTGLPTISKLFLDANQLTSLPNSAYIPHVRQLSLADNHITGLDPSIAQLAHVYALDLSDNALTDIALLAHLKRLAILILKRNKIDAHHAKQFFKLMMPNNILHPEPLLPDLVQLDLSGNPVSAKKVNALRKKVNKHRSPDQKLYVGNLLPLASK